jgi:hypothetical protein
MKHLEEECNEVLKPKLEQKEKQCQVNYIMWDNVFMKGLLSFKIINVFIF